MIETILVYLAGAALSIALFFALVARIVRLIMDGKRPKGQRDEFI